MMREMSVRMWFVHREQQDKLYKTLCGEEMIIINKPINIPTQRTIAFPSTHTPMLHESYSVSPGAGQRERTHGKPFLASVQYASRWIEWNLLHFNGHYRLHCSASTFNSYDSLAEQMRAEHYILLTLMWCRVLCCCSHLKNCAYSQNVRRVLCCWCASSHLQSVIKFNKLALCSARRRIQTKEMWPRN